MSEQPALAWSMPQVAGPVISSRGRSGSATDLSEQFRSEQRRVFEDARRQGFEQGLAEGRAVRDRLSSDAASLAQVLQSAAAPLRQWDQALADELTQLALGIGKQLARRELQMEPAQVAAIVRETIALLPANSREVRVILHPADAAVLRECLAPASAERAWQILEDPVMSRGGCRVESEHARIDARFESRVAAIAASLLDSEASAT